MLEVKAKVYNALINDSALITLLGDQGKIQFFYPNDFTFLPVVTYQEINQSHEDQGYFDDAPNSYESTIQIDVWANSSTTEIVKEIDRIMIGMFFNIDFSGDLYEPDSKVYHRVLHYRRSFTAYDLV